MGSLGSLEAKQGNPGQARHWYGEAIATGHADNAPRSMVNLAFLELKQGNVAEARRWLGEAIVTGHPKVAVRAEQELRNLNRHEGERRRAGHAGRYGWQASADRKPMKPGNTLSESDQLEADEEQPRPQLHRDSQVVRP